MKQQSSERHVAPFSWFWTNPSFLFLLSAAGLEATTNYIDFGWTEWGPNPRSAALEVSILTIKLNHRFNGLNMDSTIVGQMNARSLLTAS